MLYEWLLLCNIRVKTFCKVRTCLCDIEFSKGWNKQHDQRIYTRCEGMWPDIGHPYHHNAVVCLAQPALLDILISSSTWVRKTIIQSILLCYSDWDQKENLPISTSISLENAGKLVIISCQAKTGTSIIMIFLVTEGNSWSKAEQSRLSAENRNRVGCEDPGCAGLLILDAQLATRHVSGCAWLFLGRH